MTKQIQLNVPLMIDSIHRQTGEILDLDEHRAKALVSLGHATFDIQRPRIETANRKATYRKAVTIEGKSE